MRIYPIPLFSVDNASNFNDEKRGILGVGVPQRLVDADGPALLDRLLVLIDLLFRELPDKTEAELDLLGGFLCINLAHCLTR
jgi:hypothetical protein